MGSSEEIGGKRKEYIAFNMGIEKEAVSWWQDLEVQGSLLCLRGQASLWCCFWWDLCTGGTVIYGAYVVYPALPGAVSGVVTHRAMACVSVLHDTRLVRLIQLGWRYYFYSWISGTSDWCEELFHWDFPPFSILLEWCHGQVIVGMVDQVGGFRPMGA